jgi:hypothetical protein
VERGAELAYVVNVEGRMDIFMFSASLKFEEGLEKDRTTKDSQAGPSDIGTLNSTKERFGPQIVSENF